MSFSKDESVVLTTVEHLNVLGNRLSLEMVGFLDQVKSQPSGFRELGLDFLSLSQLLNPLEEQLKEHFRTKKSFPPAAFTELLKILGKTAEDFTTLQTLLKKYMEYEKGGVLGKLAKTYRQIFIDKEIPEVRASLQANKAALTMTMHLVNM